MDNEILAKYICGEATPEEETVVKRWMDESLRNRQEVERLQKELSFVTSRYHENRLDTGWAWNKLNLAKKKKIDSVSFRRRWLQIAALIIILFNLAGGLYVYFMQGEEQWITEMAYSQPIVILLPDSTCVTLASNSSIRYETSGYKDNTRKVELEGKAFFEVKKDPLHPFRVETSMATVEVLGTSFQVEVNENEAAVNVKTGKVRFTANKREDVILTAGMSATYNMENKKIEILSEEDINYLSWKTGQLKFNHTPLSEVIKDLNEYYQVTIISKEDTGNPELTVTFNNMPLEDVLSVINQTLNTNLTIKK